MISTSRSNASSQKFSLIGILILSAMTLNLVHTASSTAQSSPPLVVFSETFDSYTPGSCIAGPVWTAEYGCVKVAESPHPNWHGNAVDGRESTAAPQGRTGAVITTTLADVPTVGVLELSFRAWAPLTPYTGGEIALLMSQREDAGTVYTQSIRLAAWTNIHVNNIWQLYAPSSITGGDEMLWQSPSRFMRDVTVQVTIILDYDTQQFWARLDDGTQQVITPKFPFLGSMRVAGISVYEDDRRDLGETLGLDIDNIVLTTSAPPVFKPTKGGNTGTVTMSFHSYGLLPGTSVRLSAPNVPDIVGQNTQVVSPVLTRTTFDLRGAQPGMRHVIITTPNDTVLVLEQTFTVEEGGSAKAEIRKAGTRAVPGRVLDYSIVVENTGNIDATDFPVLEILDPARFRLLSVSPPTVVDIPTLADASVIQWVIPKIAPGEMTILSYQVRLHASTPLGTILDGGPVCEGLGEDWAECLAGSIRAELACAPCQAAVALCTTVCAGGVPTLQACLSCLAAFTPACISRTGSGCIPVAWQAAKSCFDAGRNTGNVVLNCFTSRQIATGPVDPNEKIVISKKFIRPDQLLVYPIHFENIGNAEAQDVFITDVLDPHLDVSTLQIFTPNGSFDPVTRTLKWNLLGINLPPGETGNVLLSIRPVPNLPSGTEIQNSATIQFEVFAPLVTEAVVNIIDSTPPQCTMTPLPPTTFTPDFTIAWSGTDAVGEIDTFTILVSVDGGTFTPFLENTRDIHATFHGEVGKTYSFLCTALDTAGNVEVQPSVAEVSTKVQTPAPIPGDLNGDRKVDCADIALVKASFGKNSSQPGFDPRADANGDNMINVKDLAFVAQKLPVGTKCP